MSRTSSSAMRPRRSRSSASRPRNVDVWAGRLWRGRAPEPGTRLIAVEPLGQEDGQVVEEQVVELVGVAERLVGRGVLALQAVEHLGEPRLHVGRRSLDVDEARQVRREDELVLEAGDLHVGRDPPVALPVDADEHVGLGQVRAVERARWVWAGPELEHHRGEPELLDRRARGLTFVGELTERRRDEDAQPLIGGSDRPHRHGASVGLPIGPGRVDLATSDHGPHPLRGRRGRRHHHDRPSREAQRHDLLGAAGVHPGHLARLETTLPPAS